MSCVPTPQKRHRLAAWRLSDSAAHVWCTSWLTTSCVSSSGCAQHRQLSVMVQRTPLDRNCGTQCIRNKNVCHSPLYFYHTADTCRCLCGVPVRPCTRHAQDRITLARPTTVLCTRSRTLDGASKISLIRGFFTTPVAHEVVIVVAAFTACTRPAHVVHA